MTGFDDGSRRRGAACARSGARASAPRAVPQARTAIIVAGLCGALVLPGCALRPEGTRLEQEKLGDAGKAYEPALEERSLPELPASPTWRDVLSRAFLGNAELEASYFEWKAAVSRIDVASGYLDSNLQLGYSYMFSSEGMKTFDRQTFTLGFDPAMPLSLPSKVRLRGKVALDEAREAGARFLAMRFDLQKRVLFAWADYKAQAALVSLREQDAALRRTSFELARVSAGTGGSPARVVEGQVALAMADNELAQGRAELGSMRAMLNGMLARGPDLPLGVPDAEEPIPGVPDDGSALLATVDVFPEVAVDVERLAARRDALELARQRWLPDISPTAVFTGNLSQALGAMLVVPTNAVQIRATIEAAKSGVREAEARLRQKRSDRMGEYVSLLLLAKDAQRRAEFAEGTLLPLADRLADLRARDYSSGGGDFEGVLESRRMGIEASTVLIEARRSYEKAMVDIACCLGVGLDRLGSIGPSRASADAGVLPEPRTSPAPHASHNGAQP